MKFKNYVMLLVAVVLMATTLESAYAITYEQKSKVIRKTNDFIVINQKLTEELQTLMVNMYDITDEELRLAIGNVQTLINQAKTLNAKTIADTSLPYEFRIAFRDVILPTVRINEQTIMVINDNSIMNDEEALAEIMAEEKRNLNAIEVASERLAELLVDTYHCDFDFETEMFK